jgi:hypothetical protein
MLVVFRLALDLRLDVSVAAATLGALVMQRAIFELHRRRLS